MIGLVLTIAAAVFAMTVFKRSTPAAPGTTPALAPAIEPSVYLEPKHTVDEFKIKFFRAIKNVDIGIFEPKVLYSVATLETGHGTGGVFRKTRNLYSITRGSSWKEKTYRTTGGLEFRIYGKWEDSIKDFVRLMQIGLYRKAYESMSRKDVPGFFAELKAAGYDATSPTYARDLLRTYREV